MQALLDGGQQSTHDRSLLAFVLAGCAETKGAYDEAFRHYRQANDLKREVYRQSNQAYDPRKHRGQVDQLISFFTADFFERTRSFGSASEQPVFVVGMVRSGTTLVE